MADDPDSLPDYQDPDEELYEEFNKIFELDGEHLNNEPDGWPYDSGYVESEPVMRFALNDTFGRTLEVKSREYAPPSEDFYLGTMKRWTWRSPKLGDGKTLVKIECFEQGSDVGQEMWGSLELKMEDDGQGGNHPVYDVRIRDADVPDVPHWKHAFLETIDVYRGPGRDITIEERGKWRVFRNFSNFRAAKTFHEILTASLRLVPRAMPMPGGPGELPPAYGQAWTYSFEEGSTSYFSYQIEKPGDYCNVCASFKKTGDNSEWAQLRHDRTMWASITGPTAKETIWQLHFGPPQDPVFWFKNMEDGQTYYVTKRVEAGLPNELPDNAYVSDVFPCTGRWTRANIFKSASPPWNSNIVELYVCCDDDNTIIDRVIQKRFPYLGNKHSLEATEVPLHLELTHNAMNDCIIALRAVSRRKPIPFDARNLPPYEPSGLRMFVEYAAKGNLYALIEHYHDKKAHVPEVFIWILLRNLARACIKLETPAIGQVNQDVKPDNIFIQDCQPDRNFPGYHYPVLGDFGLCFQAGGPVNGAGTPGFFAPEQQGQNPRYPGLGDNTDNHRLHVYGIGLSLWSVMRLKPQGLVREQPSSYCQARYLTMDPSKEPGLKLFRPKDYHELYSTRLEELVLRCVAVDKRTRPKLEDLLEEAEAALASFSKRVPGLENMKFDDLPPWFRLDTPAGQWNIGDKHRPMEHQG